MTRFASLHESITSAILATLEDHVPLSSSRKKNVRVPHAKKVAELRPSEKEKQFDLEHYIFPLLQSHGSVGHSNSNLNLVSNQRAGIAETASTLVSPVQERVNERATEENASDYRRSITELVLREVLLRIISTFRKDMAQLLSWSYDLFDLTVQLAAAGHIDSGTVFLMFEDLIDTLPRAACEDAFTYLELRKSILPFGKGLTVLRTCNELLRRLSRAMNTGFCGRILMFLATLFPLGDRSGVNLKGDYNTENMTVVDDPPIDEEMKNESNSIETLEEDVLIPYQFYSQFWSLQQYFSYPPQCLTQWDVFSQSVDAVIQWFDKEKVVLHERTLKESDCLAAVAETVASKTILEEDLKALQEEHFNAKYLSCRPLLGLQLRDVSFRREWIVQCLMVLHGIELMHRSNAKPSHSSTSTSTTTATLTATQLAWLESTRTALYKQLTSLSSNGSVYNAAVQRVLSLEETWVYWKRDGCPDFEKAPLTEHLSKVPEYTIEALNHLLQPEAEDESMASLWQLDLRPETITEKLQSKIPSLDAYLEPLEEQMDPSNDIDEQYRLSKDHTFVWKALRLIAEKDVTYFHKMGHANLETFIRLYRNETKTPLSNAAANSTEMQQDENEMSYSSAPMSDNAPVSTNVEMDVDSDEKEEKQQQ